MTVDVSKYSAILLDLDGTIFHDENALPGAVELLRRLASSGRKFACISNSTESPQRLVVRLEKMGVKLEESHVYTAAEATVDYFLEHYSPKDGKPRAYNLATEGVQELLVGRATLVEDADEECAAVIVGTPVNIYARKERQRTALLLARKGAAILGICADRVFPSPRGLEFGAGALSHMLAYAAAATPIFCGKPVKIFFEELCHRLNVEPRECLLVGDNLESDIAGGKAMGMATVLTLTGVTGRDEVDRLAPDERPDMVIDDLRQLMPAI